MGNQRKNGLRLARLGISGISSDLDLVSVGARVQFRWPDGVRW